MRPAASGPKQTGGERQGFRALKPLGDFLSPFFSAAGISLLVSLLVYFSRRVYRRSGKEETIVAALKNCLGVPIPECCRMRGGSWANTYLFRGATGEVRETSFPLGWGRVFGLHQRPP